MGIDVCGANADTVGTGIIARFLGKAGDCS
jgi:hypothetical protein